MLLTLSIGLMVLMTVLGIRLIVRSGASPHDHPACGRCGYDVTATVGGSGRCPECGSALIEVGVLPPRGEGPRRRAVLWLGVAMLVAVASCVGTGLIGGIAMTRSMAARQQAIAARQQAAAAQQQALAAQRKQAQQQVVEPPDESPQQEGEQD